MACDDSFDTHMLLWFSYCFFGFVRVLAGTAIGFMTYRGCKLDARKYSGKETEFRNDGSGSH